MAASADSSPLGRDRTSRRGLLLAAVSAPLAAAIPLMAGDPAYAKPGPNRHRANTNGRIPNGRNAGGSGRLRAPVVGDARPHPELTAAFETYGNSGDGWSGADSTYSAKLPDGRQLWMFSDTFIGPVNADGSRPNDIPIINNSFVLRGGGEMSTVHGGTDQDPTAVLVHPEQDHWYWLGASTLAGGSLDILFPHFARTGDGMWDFEWRSNALGRFDPATLKPLSTHRLPSSAHIQWASWVLPHERYTYVYGVEDRGDQKHMHIARVEGTDLTRPWAFFDGTGWSPNETDSARVLTGVSNEYSVTPWRDGFLLVTQDTSTAFSPDILGYVADSPTGPFRSPTLLYSTPETGAQGSYGDPDVFTYNPHEHPELRDGNRLLITYNVNSTFEDILADVTKYRPRFVEITLE